MLIILFVESDTNNKDKKPKLKTKILKRIFRQDEVSDSTPEGPPVDHSNAHNYGLLHSVKCEDVKIPCPDEENFIKGWFMEPDDSVLTDTVVLYSHGVSNTRGASYRVALYNILVMQGVTVMAYDYRGFGDSSTAVPAEDSVVQDCRTVLQWLRTRIARTCRIVVSDRWLCQIPCPVLVLAGEDDERIPVSLTGAEDKKGREGKYHISHIFFL